MVCGRGVVEAELSRFFSTFGAVQSVRCLHDKGVAYVKFTLGSEAALALERIARIGEGDRDGAVDRDPRGEHSGGG